MKRDAAPGVCAMLDRLQKVAAQAIVNVFETGSARGDYGAVTLLSGDTGHLTYGRAQTTLASGNLYLLIKAYCEMAGAALGGAFGPYLERLQRADLSLDGDMAFRALLKDAGHDPVMQSAQDDFFDRVYWAPALASAESIGAKTALGTAVVYDSRIHGSWGPMRDRTTDRFGRLADIGEEAWITDYVATRRDWLANSSNALLRKTVYRMDSFAALIAADNWDLALPFFVRGVRIDDGILEGPPPVRASAEPAGTRVLLLRRPFMRGDDVHTLQQALADAGIAVDVDGVFGPGTEAAVIAFQSRQGLGVDGAAGPATLGALGLA